MNILLSPLANPFLILILFPTDCELTQNWQPNYNQISGTNSKSVNDPSLPPSPPIDLFSSFPFPPTLCCPWVLFALIGIVFKK